MKKNQKKAVTLAGVGLAAVAGVAIMETPVHADNVTTQAPNSTSNNVQGNDLKAKQDESRHVYADAKAKEQQTQSAMDKAASADSQAQVDLKSATVAESTAAATLSQDKQNASDAQTKYDSAVSQVVQTSNRDDIRKAQSAYNQARFDWQTAIGEQKIYEGTVNSATNNDNQAIKNLADKKAAEATAQEALTKAQADKDTPETELTQKQNDLQKAKEAVDQATKEKTQADANLAAEKDSLAKAQEAYKKSLDPYKQAKDKLDQLTSEYQEVTDANNKMTSANQALQKAQDEYAKAKDALTKATATAKAAAQAHTEATAEHGKASNALITAKNNLITDRTLYADSVRLKPVGDVYVNGAALPKVEIANPMVKDPTQDLLYTQFLKMAGSEMDSIPTGTVVGWMTGFKIKDDMKQPGTYTEDALVTFPDGSSFTLPATFTVKAAPATPDNPTGTAGQPGSSQSTSASRVNGAGASGHQGASVVAGTSQGHQGTMNQSQGGQQVAMNEQAKLSAQARQSRANAALPQTGADHNQGLLALGMAGLVTMFGLFGINRKQRN